MLSALGLGIALSLQDGISSGMDKVTDKFLKFDGASTASVNRFNANTRQFKMGLGIMAAGGASLGAAFALAIPAGRFEQELAGLGTISGALPAELKAMEEAALQA